MTAVLGLVLIVVMALPVRAGENDDLGSNAAGVTVEAAPRWGGSPPGAWTPYVVTVANNGPVAIDGEVVLSSAPSPVPVGVYGLTSVIAVGGIAQPPPNGWAPAANAWPHYRARVDLAQGTTRTIEFMVVESPFGHQAELRDLAGRVLASSPPASPGRGEWTVAFLGSVDVDTIERLRVGYDFGSRARFTRFGSAAEFPDDAMALVGLQALVIDDFDSAALSTRQRRVIQDFVALGGSLVIGGGASWSRTLADLPEELVLMRPRATADVSMGVLADMGGRTSTATSTVAVGDVVRGMAMVRADDIPLVVEAGHGSGHIVQLAYDPLGAPFSTDANLGGLGLEQGLARALTRTSTSNLPALPSQGLSFDRRALSQAVPPETLWSPLYDPPRSALNPWPKWPRWDIGVLGIYTLLAGPATFLLIESRRHPGRPQRRGPGWAWLSVTALLLAAVSSVAADARSSTDTLPDDDVVESSVDVRMLGPGGVSLRNTYYGLAMPRGGAPAVSVEDGVALSTVIAQPVPDPPTLINPGTAEPAFAFALGQNVPGPGSVSGSSYLGEVGEGIPATVTVKGDGSAEVFSAPIPPRQLRPMHTMSISHVKGDGFKAELRLVPRPGSVTGAELQLEGTVTNATLETIRSVRVQLRSGTQIYVADSIKPGATARIDPSAPIDYTLGEARIMSAAPSFAMPRGGQAVIVGATDPDDKLVDGSRTGTTMSVIVQVVPLEGPGGAARRVSGALDAAGGVSIHVVEMSGVPEGRPVALKYNGFVTEGRTVGTRTTAKLEVYDWVARSWRPLPVPDPPSPTAPTLTEILNSTEVRHGVVRARIARLARNPLDQISVEPVP